jgi:hypothetical protein
VAVIVVEAAGLNRAPMRRRRRRRLSLSSLLCSGRACLLFSLCGALPPLLRITTATATTTATAAGTVAAGAAAAALICGAFRRVRLATRCAYVLRNAIGAVKCNE